jgi:hypothetical protein
MKPSKLRNVAFYSVPALAYFSKKVGCAKVTLAMLDITGLCVPITLDALFKTL